MHEGAGRVVAQPVVEDSRYDVDLLGPGLVHIQLEEARSRIDLQKLRPGPARALPKDALSHARVDLLRRHVLAEYMDDFGHVH
jgi:hypothetical protein